MGLYDFHLCLLLRLLEHYEYTLLWLLRNVLDLTNVILSSSI